jgi:class 3 adenylate cyclase
VSVGLLVDGRLDSLDGPGRPAVPSEVAADVLSTQLPVVHADDAARAVVLPVAFKGRPAGVLVVRRAVGEFGVDEQALLRSFAAQASVALENTRLYGEIDGLFRQYMSPAIVTALLADPAQAGLGGRVVEVTSLFADLRGFTAFSERTDPGGVVAMLNRYFAIAVPTVLEHGGTVTQFAGDNIMAVFNAPVRQPDHPLRAARAALAVQGAVASVVPGDADAPRFRIGINTGLALVGNVGADIRCYTANGDSVNLAARLEGLAEAGGVVIGEATRSALGAKARVHDLGPLQVKGKDQPVRAFALIGLAD